MSPIKPCDQCDDGTKWSGMSKVMTVASHERGYIIILRRCPKCGRKHWSESIGEDPDPWDTMDTV